MSDYMSEPDMFVRLNFSFHAIVALHNHLATSAWDFTVDVMPDDDLDLNSAHVRGAIIKMKYWINEIVDGSILFSNNNKWAMRNFFPEESKFATNNNLILVPGDVSDEVIARVLHSKLMALSGNHLIVGPLEIMNADGGGASLFFTGETNTLPDMDAWIGERSFFATPWWERDDGSTMDVVPSTEDDITIKPNYAVSLDFLIGKRPRKRKKKAELIRHNFKPKIIIGGA